MLHLAESDESEWKANRRHSRIHSTPKKCSFTFCDPMYMFKCFRFGPKLSAKSCIHAFKLQLFSFSLCIFFRCGHVELCFIFPFYLCECFFFICLITRKDIEYRLVQVVGVTSNRLMCRERERKNKQTVHGK